MKTPVAIIDDDSAEHVLISHLAETFTDEYVFTGFLSVERFLECDGLDDFRLIFLDQRLPPYTSFNETLPMLEGAVASDARIVLMSADIDALSGVISALTTSGPVSKSDLLDPETLKSALTGRG